MRRWIWFAAAAVLIAAMFNMKGNQQTSDNDDKNRVVNAPLIGTFARRSDYMFRIDITGGFFPTVTGETNAPDGTAFAMLIKRPWLPDARERLARGLAACGENCFPATGPDGQQLGITFVVTNGRFSAGPFSFQGKPFWPAEYPLEISKALTDDTPVDRIKDIATPVFVSRFQLRSDGTGVVVGAAN